MQSAFLAAPPLAQRARIAPSTFALPEAASQHQPPAAASAEVEETDVVVVGGGIGGLSCAALLASYGLQVTLCESHTVLGGAAHSFERDGFTFDCGPSLFSGISSPSPSPLRQVLDAIGETVDCYTYSDWGVHIPEGSFVTGVGGDAFIDVLRAVSGPAAEAEWRRLQDFMRPLAAASVAVPPAAIRLDPGVARSLAPFLLPGLRSALAAGPAAALMASPFEKILDAAGVQDKFIRRWLNLLCFLLSGMDAKGTIGAEMCFMFHEFYRPDCVLDFPKGGSAALVAALARGVTKRGGRILTGAHVDQIMVEGGRAAGVRLRSGAVIRARRAVVSNAFAPDTLKLLPPEALPESSRRQVEARPELDSFVHLHVGLRGELPADLPCHHAVVADWDDLTGEQNVVLVSIPSLLDPSLAPPGCHVVHAYTPATEPHGLYAGMDRRSEEYRALKERRAEVLWRALEKAVPDARSRAEVALVGTPLTQARYLRRSRGSYGPAIRASEGFFPLPQAVVPGVKGLYSCGDSAFPGVGMPAVAASGLIVANSLAPVEEHLRMLARIAEPAAPAQP
eukprot:tig00020723_g13427.t1